MTARSSWWASDHHRALSAAPYVTERLAIALGAVRSVVRVIDNTVPPMTVDWYEGDGEEGLSYTDMRGHAIKVNPDPITADIIDPADALDVCIGFGMHEAGHSQESRGRYEVLLKRVDIEHPSSSDLRDERTIFNKVTGKPTKEVPAFEPIRIAAYLWNLVEDPRMEAVTTAHWPGFAPYFERLIEWLGDRFADKHPEPLVYGQTVAEHLTFAYATCRLGVASRNTGEATWWTEWQADYLAGRADTATTIERALDHLAENAAAEIEKMVEQEQAERAFTEAIRELVDRLIAEGVPGAPDICSPGDGIDPDTASAVRELVQAELTMVDEIITAEGASKPRLYVRRPEETAASRGAYVGRPDAETEALRAALVFRNSDPQWDEKLLRQGAIDDEELYRWAEDDDRVFSQHVIESRPDVLFGLLVDLSGSMYGAKLTIAQRLAQLFVWGLHDQEGIETRVWGHTADVDQHGDAQVYRIWEPGDPLSRLGLIQTLPHSSNADGHAIAYCASQMVDAPQPQKVLVVLSDGLPSADCYGRSPAHAHVRAVCRWAEARGIKVLQIAIDPKNLRPAEQEAMFGPGNWLGFTTQAQLPRQLAAVMARFS